MKLAKIAWMATTVLLAATLASCGKQEEPKVEKAAADVKAKAEADAKAVEALAKEKEAQEAAVESYIYAYPLVTMELTRRVSCRISSRRCRCLPTASPTRRRPV